MVMKRRSTCNSFIAIALLFCISSCGPEKTTGEDAQVTTRAAVEVTAQVTEIPEPFRDDPLYDYAYVLKYKVLKVHRGTVEGDTIYVGMYNPQKPRDKAADARSGDIGGNVQKIQAGDVHRLALETNLDDHYMGGIINKYFDTYKGPIYWAVWTNKVVE